MGRRLWVAAVLGLSIVLPPVLASPRGPAAGGACTTETAATVAPQTVFLGQETSLTLTVRADCSRIQVPVHVAFVVDNSLGMGGPRIADMRQGVAAFVEALDFTTARMGLAAYHSHVDILSELTADAAVLKDQTQLFRPRPGSNLALAVRAGRQILERGRSQAAGAEFQEALILLVGTPFDGTRDEVLAEAKLARDAGMLVVTIASGDPDLDTLQAVASGPSFFHTVGNSSQYPSVFRGIAGELTAVHVTSAQVQGTLPANMTYVWGSGIPAPRVRDRDLSWLYASWPPEGITISFGIEPTELGHHPLTAAGEVRLTLDRGGPQLVPLPTAYVDVLVVPTATAVPPTASPSPSVEPPTPPPTAPPEPHRAYLPVALADHCQPAARGADVVLVVDTSASMLQRSSGDLTRLDLAQDATSLFVDRLDLPRDRAAVVVFQTAAEVLQPVTGDRGALQTALAKLHGRVADGSRLDLGLAAAAGLLANPDAAANRPVIVLLTDGQPDDVAATRATAAAVRDAGVTLYTVGLGADVDDRLLAELAGRPARCLVSPDGVDLNQIYLEIARRTGCADPP